MQLWQAYDEAQAHGWQVRLRWRVGRVVRGVQWRWVDVTVHHHLQFQSKHASFDSEAAVALPQSFSLAASLVFGASTRQAPISRLMKFWAKVRLDLLQYFMISYEILHMFVYVGSANKGLVQCLSTQCSLWCVSSHFVARIVLMPLSFLLKLLAGTPVLWSFRYPMWNG